jgi:glycine hydroxymethyltransferase
MTREQNWYEPVALEFQRQVLENIEGLSAQALADRAIQLDREQQDFLSRRALCLYPGANILSPRVAALLGSISATRASEGHPGAKYQTGLHWVEEAEVLAAELIRRLFGAEYAEVRAISGSMANMAVLNSLTEPGDTIFSLPTPVGGHISHAKVGAAGYRRLNIHDIPYDARGWQIKLDELRHQVKSFPPKLIIVGASLILFQYPLSEIRQIADEVGAWVMYDAAHVAGLIAGGAWQHPLREGAHVMTASTYKSLGGPPGGIILTDEAGIARGVDRAVFPGMTANFHTNRMPALAVAAAEMLEFGRAYARDCVANSQALARSFDEAGLNVCGQALGYSDGHMLALDVSEQGGGKQAAAALEAAHLICNMNLLPWDSLKALHNPSGIRLAVHEVTRWGMGQAQMRRIGQLFAQVLFGSRPPDEVRSEVVALKSEFDTIQYCFN